MLNKQNATLDYELMTMITKSDYVYGYVNTFIENDGDEGATMEMN